jgi:hypothetical protein
MTSEKKPSRFMCVPYGHVSTEDDEAPQRPCPRSGAWSGACDEPVLVHDAGLSQGLSGALGVAWLLLCGLLSTCTARAYDSYACAGMTRCHSLMTGTVV